MAFMDSQNKVPHYQKAYQKAYKAHTRIWRIHPRSGMLMTPFTIALWGTTAATMYAMGRRIFGHNTWFSD